MNIAIVGATGVLGRNLIPILLNNGHKVTALIRDTVKAQILLPGGVTLSRFDLLESNNENELVEILSGSECVIHAATAIPADLLKTGALDNNNKLRTSGTLKLLNASLKAGVKRYIQQSIIMAYPDNGVKWITEDMPLDRSESRSNICGPVIEMESMVKSVPLNKIEWNILRGGRFVGKDTFQEITVSNIKNGTEIIPGDGMNFISLIHVKDMAKAIANTVDSGIAGELLNIVDEPIRQKDYIERLAVFLGRCGYIFNTRLPGPPSQKCSNRLAKELLNWEPEEDIYAIGHQPVS